MWWWIRCLVLSVLSISNVTGGSSPAATRLCHVLDLRQWFGNGHEQHYFGKPRRDFHVVFGIWLGADGSNQLALTRQ